MNARHNTLSAAVGSLLVLGLASGNAVANDTNSLEKTTEKCFGIAKAGKNDCAGNKSAHACASHASKNGDPLDWVVLPKGTCEKISGGTLKSVRKKSTRK